jgi:hypothetical protein
MSVQQAYENTLGDRRISDRFPIVWAVISVGERITRGRDPTQPLSGGPMSIFAPSVMKAETVIECVGVFTSADNAQWAAQQHISKNPNHRIKIKVCTLDGFGQIPVDETPAGCQNCGRPVVAGVSFCGPCQQAHWAACRESDPELLEELAAAIKT